MNAEPVEQIDEMRGEADRYAHVGEGVFEDQVPSDDPCDEFAERGVAVRVGRAGNGNHAGEFCIAEARESAHNRDKHQRDDQRGPCSRTPGNNAAGMMQRTPHQVDDRRLRPRGFGGGIAADRRSDDSEDARADDDADTKCRERNGTERFLQRVLRPLRFGNQLVDGFGGEDLSGQGAGSPSRLDLWDCHDCKRSVAGRRAALDSFV